ncbi:hypothetical protein PSENEW3n2_00000895 [Picochlorum sp. SENEW3]|nr:hypothetical protein PSENEW3n2_00000895 [Picochlorum sp. SENEW3]WPT14951.1 hypothetical protein PSENEW3_00000895 [Picochlorum sp. SENEW3]
MGLNSPGKDILSPVDILKTEIDENVYYHGIYWNDYEHVRKYNNRMSTGNESVVWWESLLSGNRGPFHHALIINCGNGWVERDLFLHRVIDEATGIDISAELLSEAEEEARKGNLPIRYYLHDANSQDPLPQGDWDLILNFAALHHVAYIDRFLRKIANRCGSCLFVNMDYVGPHRNQYPKKLWAKAQAVNLQLPEQIRQNFKYPHIPTMIKADPSEAIHSELIQTHIERYFSWEWKQNLGGAIAYLILTHNHQFYDSQMEQKSDILDFLVQEDYHFTMKHPETTLFLYAGARVKGEIPEENLIEYTKVEEEREGEARKNGGMYYPQTDVSIESYGDFGFQLRD